MKTLFAELDDPSTLDDLWETWQDCQRCEFWPARKKMVRWSGTSAADIIFVGQYPGREEDRKGKAYVGPAGVLCRNVATQIAKIPKELQLWTNTIHCRPIPQYKQVHAKHCAELLDLQIDIVQPRLIVAMGLIAAKRLARKDSMKKTMQDLRQKRFTYRDIPGMIVLFPAAYFQQVSDQDKRKTGRAIREDFEAIGEVYRGLKATTSAEPT
jgi:DNA polymerase